MSGKRINEVSFDLWRPQSLFSHTILTSSQIEQLNSEGGIAISFRPCSSIHLSFEGSQSTALSIWSTRSRYGFTSVPKFSSDLFTIRFIISGVMLRNNRNGDSLIGCAGSATFLSFEDMVEDRASSEFSALGVTLTREALLIACEALAGVGPRPLPLFVPVVEVIGAGMLALWHSAHAIQRMLQMGRNESDFIFPLMEEIIGYQIVSVWPKIDTSTDKSPEPMKNRSIDMAVTYINSMISRKMTISEIANIAGVGVRSLQSSFREQFGCTPFQYIINRRLEKVHEMLLVSDGQLTIREIAMQWGFVHMSDFSRRYRLRYGNSPKMIRSNSSP